MSSDDSATLVIRYLEAALAAGRSGDFTAADELLAEDATFHDPGPSASSGRSTHQKRWKELVGAFAELAFDVHDLIGAGERVVVRWSMRGTHGGEFAGVTPTDRELAMSGITIYRVEDGRIAEAWSSYDELGVLEQLGVLVEGDDGDDENLDPQSDLGMIV